MRVEWSILVLGEHDSRMSALAERCRRLGYHAFRSDSAAHAIELARDRGLRFGVACVPSSEADARLGDALASIRNETHSPHMVAMAVGDPPNESDRASLRRAGVKTGLFEPIDELALRFHLNQSLSAPAALMLRAEERVPAGWRAIVWTGGRDKATAVYSASCGGVYCATSRPSQSGAEVAVELELPDGALTLSGYVLYTSVPGNLRRTSLPDGMAVCFDELSSQERSQLERQIAACAARYHL